MGIFVCNICPKRSLKVKSTMALCFKIHFMRCTNHVQNMSCFYQKVHNYLLCCSTSDIVAKQSRTSPSTHNSLLISLNYIISPCKLPFICMFKKIDWYPINTISDFQGFQRYIFDMFILWTGLLCTQFMNTI